MQYDLVIVGGGPAGTAAGVYASRKKLKTALIAESFGGQSIVSEDIQNWIGTVSIKGEDLAKNFKKHLEAYAGDSLEIKEREWVETIIKEESGFLVKTQTEALKTKSVLIATGSKRRKLDIPGAEEFENKGITYCASCDGPMFGNKDVVVIGGGNAGFETSAELLAHAKSVTLLNRSDKFKADEITVEKMLSNPKMKAIKNARPIRIEGDKFVRSITYLDLVSNQEITIEAEGVFVEIGLIPSTEIVKSLVKLNNYNQIIVDFKNQRTSEPGIWSAGDCTDGLYHQNNIAAGDAVKALEDIYMYLQTNQ